MKTFKRVISGVLAAVMVAASASFVAADQITFTDVSDHWAWQRGYIPYLVEKGVLNGYKQDDGSYMFKPEATVTRAEFIKMLDETFGLTETTDIKNKFTDVPENEWFYSYFAKAVEQGYILNYGTKASPNGDLSREEATSLLVRYLALPENEKVSTSTFSDYNKINSAYRNDVLKAAKAEVINGYEEDDGTYTFRPQNTLTRAEALTILYRAAGAIFTKDATAAEASAYEKNAVVKNGGITLTNQKLKGRVIVSEGADNGTIAFYRTEISDTLYIRGGANIIFDAAKIKNVVVDSKDIINITIQQGSTIENLIINERTNVTLGEGTTVNKLTANIHAGYTNISGKGAIQSAVISADNFTSSMVPAEYDIAKNITATFASKSYKGTSTSAQAFTVAPVVSVEDNYHCINLTASAAGTVRYYFTDSAVCPDADEFDSLYNQAVYGTSFEAKAGKAESEVTYQYSRVKDYKYIVLQLKVGETVYQPVLVPNEIAEGTGFTSDPSLKTTGKVEFTAKEAGTVYYMYSKNGAEKDVNKFLTAYAAQDKALKGEITTRNGSVTVKEAYEELNPYMVFMFKSSSGLCYNPVIVPLGDSGFFEEPALNATGDVAALSRIKGTLYYYFAESGEVPTAAKFKSLWDAAATGDYESVAAGEKITVTVSTSLPAKYTHAVLCIRTADGDYLRPVAVKLTDSNAHGFKIAPEVTSKDELIYMAVKDGALYYYYTKNSKVPNVTEFNNVYDSTSAYYCGTRSVEGGEFEILTFDETKAKSNPYLVLMLEDDDENTYQPVLVKLTDGEATGFTTDPYVDDASGKVYFKAEDDCKVWWYYSKSDAAVDAEDFYENWDDALYGNSLSADGGVLKSFTYDAKTAKTYPYLVIAVGTGTSGKTFNAEPVVLSLASTESVVDEAKTGIKVTSVSSDKIVVTALQAGELYYYESSSAVIPSKDEFDFGYILAEVGFSGSVTVKKDQTGITITTPGVFRFLVLQLERRDGNNNVTYEVVQVNLMTKEIKTSGSSTGSTGTGTGTGTGSVSTQTGFEVKSVDFKNNKVTIVPKYSGTLAVTIGTTDKEWTLSGLDPITVTKDKAVEIPYPSGLTNYMGEKLYIFLQLTGTSGTKYKEHPGIEIVPMS